MTLVCPTLRTVAVGVTRAGRHDGGRRLADGNRMSVPGGALLLCGAAKKNRAVPCSGLNSGVFVSLFRLFAQWPGYCCACQPELPTITWPSSQWSLGRENCVAGIMTTCFVVNDGLAAKDSRSGGGVQQSMMAVDFPRSLADTI